MRFYYFSFYMHLVFCVLQYAAYVEYVCSILCIHDIEYALPLEFPFTCNFGRMLNTEPRNAGKSFTSSCQLTPGRMLLFSTSEITPFKK